MKTVFFLSCIVLSKLSFSQHGPDTLSMSNYVGKAAQVANRLSAPLTLRTSQTDSVSKVYQDYFLELIQVKAQNMTLLMRSQAMQQYRTERDGKLKMILSPAQYKSLMRYRQTELQNGVRRMDSIMNRRH